MRRRPGPSAALLGPLLLLLALSGAGPAAASPYPRPARADTAPPPKAGPLAARGCASPCGADSQLCCGADEACTTLAGNVATCVVAGGGGGYGAYTTTWTETRTFTSTGVTHWLPAPAPTAGGDCAPAAADQQPCGPICCAGWQTCAWRGQCSLRPGFVEPSPVVVTDGGGRAVTTQYSAPFRVTGTTTITTSGLVGGGPATGPPDASASTSSAAAQAIGADGGTAGSGLSPGAIAGIVIGTVAAVALLLLLCFCCIARGLWNQLFGASGRRRRRSRERIDVYEERRSSRRTSRAPSAAYAASRKDRHDGWFSDRAGGGRRPARPAPARREKSRSSGNWWLAVAGAATGLLALLNLGKKDKRVPPRKVVSSRYSDSYDYTDLSPSAGGSSSSGRRTNYTRHTGPSHYSRSSRRP